MNTDIFSNPQRPAEPTCSGWVTAYGWYFIARVISVFLLPLATVFGHSVYTRPKAFALALVWTDIGLDAIYIAFERFTAGRFLSLDLLAMVIPLLLALWYTKAMWPRVKMGLA